MGGESSVKEAKSIKNILNTYSRASGQLINWDKSSMFFFNTLSKREKKIAKILGCKDGFLPSTYLGLPLGFLPPNSFWDNLVDHFNRKLARCKGITLCQVGNVILIKSTLQNLPTYALSLFSIPSKVDSHLERIQRNFMWPGPDDSKIYPLVAWDSIYKPKKHGGLGIRKLK